MASPILGANRRVKGARASDDFEDSATSRNLRIPPKKKKRNKKVLADEAWSNAKVHMESSVSNARATGKGKGKGTGPDTYVDDDCPHCIVDEIFINEINHDNETDQFVELVYSNSADFDPSSILVVLYNDTGFQYDSFTADMGTSVNTTNGLNVTSIFTTITNGIALINTTVDVLGTIASNSIILTPPDNSIGSSLELLGEGCSPEDFVWSIVALPNTLERVNNFQEISGCVSSFLEG